MMLPPQQAGASVFAICQKVARLLGLYARPGLAAAAGAAALISPHRSVGTGMPGAFTATLPRVFQVVKNRVCQSPPPKPRLVVAAPP